MYHSQINRQLDKSILQLFNLQPLHGRVELCQLPLTQQRQQVQAEHDGPVGRAGQMRYRVEWCEGGIVRAVRGEVGGAERVEDCYFED